MSVTGARSTAEGWMDLLLEAHGAQAPSRRVGRLWGVIGRAAGPVMAVGAGSPVTSKVTTRSDVACRSKMPPDPAARLTSRYWTQRDAARRNCQPWHARG